jgi:hypothetical protein
VGVGDGVGDGEGVGVGDGVGDGQNGGQGGGVGEGVPPPGQSSGGAPGPGSRAPTGCPLSVHQKHFIAGPEPGPANWKRTVSLGLAQATPQSMSNSGGVVLPPMLGCGQPGGFSMALTEPEFVRFAWKSLATLAPLQQVKV